MNKTKVKLVKQTKFSQKKGDFKKAEKVRVLIEDVINKPEFHSKILDADFKDRRFKNENGDETEILDNQIILNLLLSGKEQFSTEETDYEWDLKINLYRSLSTELGHRDEDTINTKKKKFRNRTIRRVASHWIHEYCHVIGFQHDFKATAIRPFSVPYLVGDIAKNILKKEKKKT